MIHVKRSLLKNGFVSLIWVRTREFPEGFKGDNRQPSQTQIIDLVKAVMFHVSKNSSSAVPFIWLSGDFGESVWIVSFFCLFETC